MKTASLVYSFAIRERELKALATVEVVQFLVEAYYSE